MGAYKYIQETLEQQHAQRGPDYKAKLLAMRNEPTVFRVERPSNVARAHSLGYKAKQGFVIARVKILRVAGLKHRPRMARRPSTMGVLKITRKKSKQWIAEERAQKKFPNLEVLNSYWVAEDGEHKWFEVIMVDPAHPAVRNDPDVARAATQRNRVYRGLTSAGKRSRGLHNSGSGSEKVRPSIRANQRRGK
jgi:large subunit ribosomal protein L15e